MALPALADIDDLEEYLGVDIESGAPEARAGVLLSQASTLVRSFTGRNWVDSEGQIQADLPDAVSEIATAVAARAWNAPADPWVLQESVGPFATTRDTKNPAIYLTKWEQSMLSNSAVTGAAFQGLGTIALTRDPEPIDGTGRIPALPPEGDTTIYFPES